MAVETEKIIVPKGGYGYNLGFTIKDSDGTARNMSTYTAVTFKVWKTGNSGTPLINTAGSWVVAASGTCSYTVVSGNFDTAGNYKYCLSATKTNVVEPCRAGDLEVEESA